MAELLLPCRFDTLEYSWVKATIGASVCLQIILWLRIAYTRLVAKHDAFTEKAKQEKTKHAEAHTVEHAKLCGDLDLETRSYMEYRQTMRHRLRKLHETVASSFHEVKAQCLPFPDKSVKVEEMIDWVVGEVKAVPNTVWRHNDNFTVLGTEGILNMLNGEGCEELNRLRDLCHTRFLAKMEFS
jgi:hypothetical protein